jgi:hypothetical protein
MKDVDVTRPYKIWVDGHEIKASNLEMLQGGIGSRMIKEMVK